jgi:hypothetical protein
MSNRTWVCVDCGKSYRRRQNVEAVPCAVCGKGCEYVHWKLHIPSPRKKKQWEEFWTVYRRETELIERFKADPRIKEITLDLLNQHWVRS